MRVDSRARLDDAGAKSQRRRNKVGGGQQAMFLQLSYSLSLILWCYIKSGSMIVFYSLDIPGFPAPMPSLA